MLAGSPACGNHRHRPALCGRLREPGDRWKGHKKRRPCEGRLDRSLDRRANEMNPSSNAAGRDRRLAQVAAAAAVGGAASVIDTRLNTSSEKTTKPAWGAEFWASNPVGGTAIYNND